MSRLLAAIMVADFITFVLIVPFVGINTELNPIMRIAYTYNPLFVGLLKFVAFMAILVLANRVEGPKKKYALTIACAITAIGVLGNVSSYLVR